MLGIRLDCYAIVVDAAEQGAEVRWNVFRIHGSDFSTSLASGSLFTNASVGGLPSKVITDALEVGVAVAKGFVHRQNASLSPSEA